MSRALVLGAVLLGSQLLAGASQGAVGFTAGSIDVDEGGSATYSIPLAVPPGTAGMEPKLALVYSSRAGNGRLGMGWALSGLSVITRCPQTLAQDGTRGAVNLDANDRFCLDGQRLMLASGTYGAAGSTYRTERDIFSRVTANGGTTANGPDWFEVRTKSGLILEYGAAGNSRIQASIGGQASSIVLAWAVNKIRDTKGNYLTVSYIVDTPNGDWYPDRIDYTSNDTYGLTASQWIQFDYESRTDVVPAYVKSALVKTTNRLAKIKTHYNGTTQIKEYRLAYDNSGSAARSRLTSITECDAAGDCLPPTTLTVQTGTATSLSGSGSGTWNMYTTADPFSTAETIVGDFNGDGRMDLAGYTKTAGVWRVCLSAGSSLAAATGPDTLAVLPTTSSATSMAMAKLTSPPTTASAANGLCANPRVVRSAVPFGRAMAAGRRTTSSAISTATAGPT
jgi:hypothetical protein